MLFDIEPGTGVRSSQAVHVRSLCQAMRQHSREVHRIVIEGEASDGTRYQRLPPAARRELEAAQQPLETQLAALAERFGAAAPDAAIRPATATRTVVSSRVEEIADLADELQPAKMQRGYGELPAPIAAELATAASELRALLQSMRRALEAAVPAPSSD